VHRGPALTTVPDSERALTPPQNHSLLKANSTTKDLNTCIQEAISNNEFQKTMVKMIHDLKEETQKLVLDLKEYVNKQRHELKRIQTNR
jgi:hypothetical protein